MTAARPKGRRATPAAQRETRTPASAVLPKELVQQTARHLEPSVTSRAPSSALKDSGLSDPPCCVRTCQTCRAVSGRARPAALCQGVSDPPCCDITYQSSRTVTERIRPAVLCPDVSDPPRCVRTSQTSRTVSERVIPAMQSARPAMLFQDASDPPYCVRTRHTRRTVSDRPCLTGRAVSARV